MKKLEHCVVLRYLQVIGRLTNVQGTFQSDAKRLMYDLAGSKSASMELTELHIHPVTPFERFLKQQVLIGPK